MENSYIVILTTCETAEQAKELATSLIESHLAACVQTHPISSTYRWNGKIEHDDEYRLIMKTSAAKYDEVEKFIKREHTYDNPQIISVPIMNGSTDYLNWIHAETNDSRI